MNSCARCGKKGSDDVRLLNYAGKPDLRRYILCDACAEALRPKEKFGEGVEIDSKWHDSVAA